MQSTKEILAAICDAADTIEKENRRKVIEDEIRPRIALLGRRGSDFSLSAERFGQMISTLEIWATRVHTPANGHLTAGKLNAEARKFFDYLK